MLAAGATTAHRTVLWVRVERAGTYRLRWRASRSPEAEQGELRFEADPDDAANGTRAFRIPEDTHGAAPLQASTVYLAELQRDERVVARACFETAPAPDEPLPRRYAFGVISCHQPFDDAGHIDPERLKTLRVAEQAFREHDVKRVLWVGDQVYSDLPAALSLFDESYFRSIAPEGRRTIFECSPEETRALYQTRYRLFWGIPAFQSLMASWASHPILDDHEIVDNFGSAPEHAQAHWRSVREGAFAAYFDYQGARVFGSHPSRPATFDHGFEYARVATYVMDLRSERQSDEDKITIFSTTQRERLEGFLADHEDKHILMIVLSVPLAHLPPWMSTTGAAVIGEGSDAADRWSYAKARDDRDALLHLLHAHRRRHPEQRLLLVGGDIHAGMVSELVWEDGTPNVVQFVSSAISNTEHPLQEALAAMAPQLRSSIEDQNGDIEADIRYCAGEADAEENPYGKTNVGVIEVSEEGERSLLRLRLISADDQEPPRPRVVFSSGWI